MCCRQAKACVRFGKKYLFFKLVFLLTLGVAHAGVISVSPGDNVNNEIQNAQPGDIIEFTGGTYNQSLNIHNKLMTAGSPLTLRAKAGEVPILSRPNVQTNIIDIKNSAFIVIDGLHITQGSYATMTSSTDGIKITSSVGADVHDIEIKNSKITYIGNVGFSTKGSGGSAVYNITFHNNEVAYVGHSGTTGEGIYLGISSFTMKGWNYRVTNNYIHHIDQTGGSQGDGIEVKSPLYDVLLQDNVIHDVRYPGIFFYGYGDTTPECSYVQANPDKRNVARGNVIFNSQNSGMQVDGPAIIENNIIFGVGVHGIQSRNNPGCLGDLEIKNNTIIDTAAAGLDLRDWDGRDGMVLTNNTIMQLGMLGSANSMAIAAQGMTGVYQAANFIKGSYSGSVSSSVIQGGSASDFVDVAGWDFYPAAGSLMVDGGERNFAPLIDYDGVTRDANTDIGAYEWTASGSPGGPIYEGFKGTGGSPPGGGESGGESGEEEGSGGPLEDGDTEAGIGLTQGALGSETVGSGCGMVTASSSFTCLLLLLTICSVLFTLRKRVTVDRLP